MKTPTCKEGVMNNSIRKQYDQLYHTFNLIIGISLFRIDYLVKNVNFEYETLIDTLCDIPNMSADIAKCTIASFTSTKWSVKITNASSLVLWL